jgi:NHL repeat-containing protein
VDAPRFDALARSFAAARSRRRLLAVAGVTLATRWGGKAAAACAKAGHSCGHGASCCAGLPCKGGVCKCAQPGHVVCHGACTNPGAFAYDPANCGACGNACAGAAICSSGACIATGVDYTFVTQWSGAGRKIAKYSPSGLAVGLNGTVYVADYAYDRIHRYTTGGRFLGDWGAFGSRAGQFDSPQDVAVGADGTVYVADFNNNRVQRFTSHGAFMAKRGAFGSGNGFFDGPGHVAVGPDGGVYVADLNRIQKFTPDLAGFLLAWGGPGNGDGQFNIVAGLAVDRQGITYASDFGDVPHDRMQRFDASGGSSRRGAAMAAPTGNSTSRPGSRSTPRATFTLPTTPTGASRSSSPPELPVPPVPPRIPRRAARFDAAVQRVGAAWRAKPRPP